MNTLGITLHYRPIKVGWCIQRGDIEAFRKAARWSFTLWGGCFNPIIPIDDPEHAKRLIDLYRVDCLYPATDNALVRSFIEQQCHVPWFNWQAEFVTGDDRIGKTSVIADLLQPINRLYETHHKHNLQAESVIQYHEWDPLDPLADAFLALFGGLPPAEECAEDYLGLIRLYLKGEPVWIAPDGPVWPLSSKMTLAGFNQFSMEEHYKVRNNWAHPGFYIGDVSNLDDLTNFWNLRAANVPLIFYDPAHAKRLSPLRKDWLTRAPRSPQPHLQQGLAIWHRPEFAVQSRDLFGEQTTNCHVSGTLWNALNMQAPFIHFGGAETLASVDPNPESPSVSFSLTNQPFQGVGKSGGQAHIVSVDPGIGLFANERFTLHFPFIPQINEFYGHQAFHSRNKARSEPGSLGIINTAGTNHLTVRSIEVSKLVTAIFESVGITAKPSAAGLVCTRLITQMGGINNCRVFRIGGVRDLIEQNAPDQSFTRSHAKQTIRAEGTSHPLSSFQDLYIEQRLPGTGLTNDAVLAHLLNKKVFQPGLKLACPNCGLDYWRSVDDLKTNSECEYCGLASNIGPQLKDRDWAFRRSGLFGRNDSQEGAIPVVLTLQQLANISTPSEQLQVTAMTLEPNGADIAPCETDFMVIEKSGRDAKIQIAIGECKTRGNITRADVQNLIQVADQFPNEKFDVYLVFAKLVDFSPEELDQIKEANGEDKRRAIILSTRELEPYFVYERTEKEFEINRHAVSFEDLAEVTDAVFFQQRRKEPPADDAVEARP